MSARAGRHFMALKVPSNASNIRIGYCTSLRFKPQLFNVLPKQVRKLHDINVEVFKKKSVTLLSTIPDESMAHTG